MSHKGSYSPSVIVNDDSEGAQPWSDPANAGASDDSYAVASGLLDALASQYLKATGFGFRISEGAEIRGIEVSVERHSEGTWPAAAMDWVVKLVKGGAIQGEDRSSWTDWPSSDSYATYGGGDDLWGLELTPQDVSAVDFGFAIRARGNAATVGFGPAAAHVDNIRMTVYYSGPDTASVLKLLFPVELDGVFEGDTALEGAQLDDAQNRADTLLLEMFADEAEELISDWERITGVAPEPGDSLQTRRDRVVASIRARGDLSRPYFISLGEAFGYTIEIDSLRPFVCGVSVCGETLGVNEIRYLWQVRVPAAGPAPDLEALFNKLKPAYCGIEFVYTG